MGFDRNEGGGTHHGYEALSHTENAGEELAEALLSLFEATRRELLNRQATPLSTYRVQFHKGFTFRDAQAIVGYLAQLGVTHLYASPYLKAAEGSTHGYDVMDHRQLNGEVGTAEDHAALCDALRRAGLRQLLDVVPNHMGIGNQNPLWMDVLENGRASFYAKTFDIDWSPLKDELQDKVLLPVLGDQYGIVLENGELNLRFREGAFFIHYYDHVFPVAPREYATILSHQLDRLAQQGFCADDERYLELLSIVTAIGHLPELEPASRNREKEVIKRRLSTLTATSPEIERFIQENVERFNGHPGDPRSFDLLDGVLGKCAYRLAHWRVAGEEINYRRFFDINTLAAIREEEPEVFEEAHQLIFEWLGQQKIHGLRIDHPDGLFDPTAYFLNLQERYFVETAKVLFAQENPNAAWVAQTERQLRRMFQDELRENPDSALRRSLYVVVEKIQGGRERIPEAWAIHGTVGYRFANSVTGLLLQRQNAPVMTEIYERFVGQPVDYEKLLYEKKKLILSASMSSEINVLARELNRISELNRRTRDFTLNSLRRALIEFIALFPVYRTYVDGGRPEIDERDIRYIEWTIFRAKQNHPTENVSIYDFLRDILLRHYPEFLSETERQVMLCFAMKLQQITGPVMAKGLEDTVFYLYNRLVALNEVGGEPERFGLSVDTFHLRNQERAERWPASMLGSSTHDTKRSEDVRARLCVLSEIPSEWREHVRKWARHNRKLKQMVDGRLAPDANEEYLFYQTVVGAWPMGGELSTTGHQAFVERICAYMHKAIKEAKLNTSWTNPDVAYEKAVDTFIRRALSLEHSPKFLEDIRAFKRRIERPGQFNAITALVLKLACPGTSDVYQGTELWDLSLVDPDNRRPVDFALRERMLNELDTESQQDRLGLCARLFANMDDGRIKMFVLTEGLRLRREMENLFHHGDYTPLDVKGPGAEHVLAFARQAGNTSFIAVIPRLVTPCLDSPRGLSSCIDGCQLFLPGTRTAENFREVFTGRDISPLVRTQSRTIDVGELLGPFPWALLRGSA